MTPTVPDALLAAVQRNCHIADARHATELPLCIYLLQMRELYRWEQGLPLGAALRHRDVGEWLDRREALWDELADQDYVALPLAGGAALDPFDADAVNERLLPQGLVYGAGRLAGGRPVFLLGELMRAEQRDGLQVLVAARELARGLAAPPGALAGNTVLLRHEALLRWLWERFEAWQLRRSEGPFSAALGACGYSGGDPAAALERMTEDEIETVLLHELGEHAAGAALGAGWAELRAATAGDRRIEPRLRALRDHLADCLVTLPMLLDRRAAASLHLWVAHLEGVRLDLFPALPAAYAAWRDGDHGEHFRALLARGRRHWQQLGTAAIALHRQHGEACHAPLAQLLCGAPAQL